MATSAADLLATVPRALAFAQARTLILETAPPVRPLEVPLAAAAGHTLAAPLTAPQDQPPAAVSAMDGFALRHGDVGEANAPMAIAGETAAGQPRAAPLPAGHAQRVFTGALLPPNADTVITQEAAEVKGSTLSLAHLPRRGAFVRPRGFDFAAGDTLLSAGTVLRPQALGLSACANAPTLSVATPPTVSLLSTGDELRAPGATLAPEHVVASNGPMIAALLQAAGAHVHDGGLLRDDLPRIATAIEAQIAGSDLLITTGGASVGDYDLVQDALASLGARPVFWQVMMRPGKPVFLWLLNGTPILGLPGNPVSAYVCARIFALPWVRKALGQGQWFERSQVVTLGDDLPANGPRHQFARARLQAGKAWPAPSQDSSLLRTLAAADLLIERAPHDSPKKAGEPVEALFLEN